MSIYEQLRPIFYPKSIALVGITIANPTHWTRTFLDALIDINFPGQLYLVNPKGGEIDGHKVYKSLIDIPSEVEYVIGTVAASAAPGLMEECARKGVKAVNFCTAGFAETGEEEGIRLEAKVAQIAHETGIRVIGPNCMGIYCPESCFSFNSGFPKDSGTVGFISQSGGLTVNLGQSAALRGVRFSKVISFGNACDLNESDVLEYLTEDPGTKIIAMYLEGVKDSKRFLHTLEQATKEKPVVLLKGGITRGGAQATLGHTGSLAGNEIIWEAVCRQHEVIWVTSLDELIDVLVTLLFFQLPKGRNVLLFGVGGGPGVLVTDQFEKHGFNVPPLPQEIKDQILAFTPIAGNSFRNPIDYAQNVEIDRLTKAVDIINQWKDIDFLATFFDCGVFVPGQVPFLPAIIDTMHKAFSISTKPTAFIWIPSTLPVTVTTISLAVQNIIASGSPVYYSLGGAARGIDLVLKYHHI